MDVFGLDTTTFEQNLREPAGGFLEITSPLWLLQAGLLIALSSSSLQLTDEDRSRLGAAVGLSSAGALVTLALAAAQGLAVLDGTSVGLATFLLSATAGLGLRAIASVDDPVALFKADASELLPSLPSPGDTPAATSTARPSVKTAPSAADERRAFFQQQLGTFYQGSALVGFVVGASFIFSPISPIGAFETELPVTHMLRQDLGVFIVGLLCPVQALLTRATKQGALGDSSVRALNLLTGLACCLLVLDGKAQTDLGTQMFMALEPGTPFYQVVQEKLGDPAAVGRSVTNTNAAFSVGLVVSCVYLFQAAFSSAPKSDVSGAAPARRR